MTTINNSILLKKSELVFARQKLDRYKLSVIIPTFNRQDQLINCIQSLNKINPSDEIIILVSDNSSDNYDSELIKIYLDSTPFDYLYYRNEKNIGAIENFNSSVFLSPSIFFMFLFDDDLLRSDINKALERIENDNNGYYFFHRFKLYYNKNISSKTNVSIFFRNLLNGFSNNRLKLTYKSLLITVPSFIGAIYKKEFFLELGGLNLNLGPTADYEFTIRYWEKYGVVRYNYQVIDYYHGENDSSNPETYELFPIDNYKYRVELLRRLNLSELKKVKLQKLILERKEFEEKSIRGINKIKHILITVGSYLNLV